MSQNSGYIQRIDDDPEIAPCPHCHEQFDVNKQRNKWITQCTGCKKHCRITYIFPNMPFLHKTTRTLKDIGNFGDTH